MRASSLYKLLGIAPKLEESVAKALIKRMIKQLPDLPNFPTVSGEEATVQVFGYNEFVRVSWHKTKTIMRDYFYCNRVVALEDISPLVESIMGVRHEPSKILLEILQVHGFKTPNITPQENQLKPIPAELPLPAKPAKLTMFAERLLTEADMREKFTPDSSATNQRNFSLTTSDKRELEHLIRKFPRRTPTAVIYKSLAQVALANNGEVQVSYRITADPTKDELYRTCAGEAFENIRENIRGSLKSLGHSVEEYYLTNLAKNRAEILCDLLPQYRASTRSRYN